MKVLQTIGRHQAAAQEGIFQYRRTPDGVEIDASVGQTDIAPNKVRLTTAEWTDILTKIKSTANTYRISRTATAEPPIHGLYNTISDAVPTPQDGWAWNDSLSSYVVAILEHEGSIDHYAGLLGGGHSTPIILAHDL